jgi:uncharacterized membrane protein
MESIKKQLPASTATRIAVSACVGFVAGALIGITLSWNYAQLAFWDTAAIVFLIWTAFSLNGRDAQATAELAVREDPGRTATDVILILASLASLAAVGGLLYRASNADGTTKLLLAAVAVISVVVSWTLIHTTYTLRYARMYYQRKGGIDFNDTAAPRFSDFAYIAFTIGMTFQVSDNAFQDNNFRRVALRHALLSFLFGTAILATTINLIAGLGK